MEHSGLDIISLNAAIAKQAGILRGNIRRKSLGAIA